MQQQDEDLTMSGRNELTSQGISDEDLQRIAFAVLRPAARIALEYELPLKAMRNLVELAIYQQAVRRGMKMKEITERFSVGMSKVAALSRDLKRHFADAEEAHGLPRQILSLLYSRPLSLKLLHRALPGFEAQDLEKAIAQLIKEKRVKEVQGRTLRYTIAQQRQRLDISPWMARIDGLNTLMDHVHNAISKRLLHPDGRGTVRNVAFRVAPEDYERLSEFYQKELFPLICELDERAGEREDADHVRLSILWSADQ